MLVRGEVNIRDPYVLLDKGKYYLYGTRSETCWGEAYGFDVFVSDDLESFEDGNLDGEYCIVGLREDLKEALDERPKTLFCAKDAKWARPVPFAKAEFGIEDDMYFSDGPSLLKTDEGKLFMAFSSWSEKGYAVGCAKSLSGKVRFTLHGPNDKYMERPLFFDVIIKGDKLTLEL